MMFKYGGSCRSRLFFHTFIFLRPWLKIAAPFCLISFQAIFQEYLEDHDTQVEVPAPLLLQSFGKVAAHLSRQVSES